MPYPETPERDYRDDELDTCDICGSYDVEWVTCFNCGGEGGRDSDDLMEEDPLWYEGVEWEKCDDCGGRGGWDECHDKGHAVVVEAKRAKALEEGAKTR